MRTVDRLFSLGGCSGDFTLCVCSLDLYVFKKVNMARKCHNHGLQTNTWYQEEWTLEQRSIKTRTQTHEWMIGKTHT